MPAATTRRSLPYPVLGDSPDVPRDIQALAVALQNVAIDVPQDVLANRPASATANKGNLYRATDTGVIYRDNGATWDVVGARLPDTGLLIGGDVDLYRTSSNVARLGASLNIDGIFFSMFGLGTQARLGQLSNGLAGLALGSAEDIILYRFSAAVLRTNQGIHADAQVFANLGAASQVRIGALGSGNAGMAAGSAEDTKIERVSAGVFSITGLATPLVSSLPGSPVDGQEVNLLVSSSFGTVWKLRYRSGSPNANKWEPVGAVPYADQASTGQVFTTTADDATLSLTVPVDGVYAFSWGAIGTHASNGSGMVAALKVNGVAGPTRTAIAATAGNQCETNRAYEGRAVSGTRVAKLQFASTSGTNLTITERYISIIPIRIG